MSINACEGKETTTGHWHHQSVQNDRHKKLTSTEIIYTEEMLCLWFNHQKPSLQVHADVGHPWLCTRFEQSWSNAVWYWAYPHIHVCIFTFEIFFMVLVLQIIYWQVLGLTITRPSATQTAPSDHEQTIITLISDILWFTLLNIFFDPCWLMFIRKRYPRNSSHIHTYSR